MKLYKYFPLASLLSYHNVINHILIDLPYIYSHRKACNFLTHVSSSICLIPCSHSASLAATVAITATVCSLVTFITGVLCGAVATVCISRWNRKGQSSKPANTQEQQQTVPVYEEVDTQSQKIELELKDNVAYGPVKLDSQSQKIELKENVAYGPMKVH